MRQKTFSITLTVIVSVFLVVGVVIAGRAGGTTNIGTDITTEGNLSVGNGTFVVTGVDGSLNIGPDNFTVDGETGDTMIAGHLTVIGGIDDSVIGNETPTLGYFTDVQANTLRVTNAQTLNAEESAGEIHLTKADMQAASYWPVDVSTLGMRIYLDEPLDPGDTGRKLVFTVVSAGSGDVLVVSGDGITVTTKLISGSYGFLLGDYIECLIVTPSTVTCLVYGSSD